MSYLHCHSCDWSQDDFYSKTYNPITKIIDSIKEYIRPRIIEWDSGFIRNDFPKLVKYTHVPVIIINNKCFSWNWMLLDIVRDFKSMFKQKWWTYKSFKKAYDKGAVCPKCGKRNFDID